ncbi:neutral zinc metallopeptidase [Kribbella sancticallisti]|uniref:Neutral zinc metallopeptidase n=1 Tax=Kribbella sancticallisti TaxID=460087 RepID=A0ABN2D4N8_9ACTN
MLLAIVAVLVAVVAVVAANRPGPVVPDQATPTSGVDDVAGAAVASLNGYWSKEMPAVYGRDLVPLRGGFQPKTPRSPAFSCGGQRQTYDDLRGNAFYCGGSDDYIAWDAASLFPQLADRYGGIAPAIVLAHEMGHAIQARAEVDSPSVVVELQADCFAGSWTKYAETSTEDPVTLTEGALDSAISTVLVLRDQPGQAASAPQAHGLGFDRVNAFQTGYESGARACAELPTKGVVTTELPFRTVEEQQTGGDLPYAQAVAFVTTRLNQFWTAALPRIAPGKTFTAPTLRPGPEPACPGQDSLAQYCDGAVGWPNETLITVHQRIGDLGTGTVLSDAWGQAVQQQAGFPATGQTGGLQRDCFTGAWVAALAAGDLESSPLSPGDLDEVVATIVSSSLADDGQRMDRAGAFDRVKALRTGLFEGLPTCA